MMVMCAENLRYHAAAERTAICSPYHSSGQPISAAEIFGTSHAIPRVITSIAAQRAQLCRRNSAHATSAQPQPDEQRPVRCGEFRSIHERRSAHQRDRAGREQHHYADCPEIDRGRKEED